MEKLKHLLNNYITSGLKIEEGTIKSARLAFVNIFAFIGSIMLFGFGLVYLFSGNWLAGIFEIGLSFFVVGLIIFLRKTGNLRLVSTGILLLMIVVSVYLLSTGGIGNSGVLWFFLFPMLIFFLKGNREGIFWTLVVLYVVLVLLLADFSGLIDIPYSGIFIRQFIVVYLIATFFVFFYQFTNDKTQSLIEAKTAELEEANERLSTSSKGLEEAGKEIFGSLSEFHLKNTELENTKKAVLNILEDLQIAKVKISFEKNKIDAILESIGDAVLVVDLNKNIIMFNKIAERLSGFVQTEVMGKPYTSFLKFVLEDTKVLNTKFVDDAIATGKIQDMGRHTLLINRYGEEIPVSDSAAPLIDQQKKIVGCVVVFRDVTKDREVDKAKTEFVSLASHQLRTPLTSLKWYTELLVSGDAGKLTEEQFNILNEVYKSSTRMSSLVNDLLNVSRLESGRLKIDPKPTDIVDFINSVLIEIKPLFITKNVKLNTYLPQGKMEIGIDMTLFHQVLHNLLTNSIKYSSPKDPVVNVSFSQQPSGEYLISVQDNGVGIPKDAQAKMFTKFYRAGNVTKTSTEGSGLGLYLAKMIMEQSGGKIWFDSVEGKGTTFFVSIPAEGMKMREGEKGLASDKN